MAQVDVRSVSKKKVGSVDLPDSAYDYPLNRHLMYEAVRHYLATARRGTHDCKNRVEVSGGGRKPWRQKGTGRARVGSTRSPLWRKGGVVHGPKPRDYSYRFPKMARRRALASALSDKLREGKLVIIDGLGLDAPKTKQLAEMVGKLGLSDKTLLVFDGDNTNIELAARNHPKLAAVRDLRLHTYHVLDCDTIVLSQAAAEKIGEVLSR